MISRADKMQIKTFNFVFIAFNILFEYLQNLVLVQWLILSLCIFNNEKESQKITRDQKEKHTEAAYKKIITDYNWYMWYTSFTFYMKKMW